MRWDQMQHSLPHGKKAVRGFLRRRKHRVRREVSRRQESVQRHLRRCDQHQRLRHCLRNLPGLRQWQDIVRRRQVCSQLRHRLPRMRQRLFEQHGSPELRRWLHTLPGPNGGHGHLRRYRVWRTLPREEEAMQRGMHRRGQVLRWGVPAGHSRLQGQLCLGQRHRQLRQVLHALRGFGNRHRLL
jgi:hypothetical protein